MYRNRNIINNLYRVSGQALVESILIIPVIVVTIVIIFWFARLLLTKQQLVMAARYGTDLIVYSNMSENDIKKEIREYLCGKDVKGRSLDPRKLLDSNIKVNISRYEKITVIDAYKLIDFNTSSVSISYQFDTPMIFYSWINYIGGRGMQNKLVISARSEVLAGTGSKAESN